MLSNRGDQEATMTNQEDLINDPFLKESSCTERLPSDASLICSYDSDFGIDSLEESAYFRRENNRDELWITSSYKTGRAYTFPSQDTAQSASLRLIGRLFRARVGFEWPAGFISPGLVNKAAFTKLVKQIERELDDNRRKALKNKAEIVLVAEELGLSPRPTGTAPGLWAANCPGTNHFLYISATGSSFGCGWCKRKGGPEELRAFVDERRR
jgi:hypothetical protein